MSLRLGLDIQSVMEIPQYILYRAAHLPTIRMKVVTAALILVRVAFFLGLFFLLALLKMNKIKSMLQPAGPFSATQHVKSPRTIMERHGHVCGDGHLTVQ